MHHGTCVTHVSWCMSWSLTGISGVCAIRNFTYLVRGLCFRALSTSIISCPSMAVLRLQQVISSQRNLLSFIRTLKPMTILQILNHFLKTRPVSIQRFSTIPSIKKHKIFFKIWVWCCNGVHTVEYGRAYVRNIYTYGKYGSTLGQYISRQTWELIVKIGFAVLESIRPPFSGRHIQMHFPQWNIINFD